MKYLFLDVDGTLIDYKRTSTKEWTQDYYLYRM